MFLEQLIIYLYQNCDSFIQKIKLNRVGSIEIFLKQDSFHLYKGLSDRFFYFNFYFSKLLKELLLFWCNSLADIVVVDYPQLTNRFCIVYNFLSIRKFFRIFVIISVNSPFVDNFVSYSKTQLYVKSLTKIFSAAYWLERENWDLFGVFFQDNNDLRRILTDYGFEGYPLRKDFPLTGFFEVRYDDEQRSVVYENLELTQEFRFFDFESPWVSLNTIKDKKLN